MCEGIPRRFQLSTRCVPPYLLNPSSTATLALPPRRSINLQSLSIAWLMGVLHTMFNYESNSTFNNAACSHETIGGMHESMERLVKAALEIRGATGHAQIARLLNESEQTITNWAKRGVSIPGAIKAERNIGCQAIWVLYGEGEAPQTPDRTTQHRYRIAHTTNGTHQVNEPVAWPLKTVSQAEWQRLTHAQKTAIDHIARSYIDGLKDGTKSEAAA